MLSNTRGVSGDSDVKLVPSIQGTLHSTANDTQTEKDLQNGPQMILDRKWSLLSTANDPGKVEEWILGTDVPWVPEAFHARFPVSV